MFRNIMEVRNIKFCDGEISLLARENDARRVDDRFVLY